jgi:hypothetical protein
MWVEEMPLTRAEPFTCSLAVAGQAWIRPCPQHMHSNFLETVWGAFGAQRASWAHIGGSDSNSKSGHACGSFCGPRKWDEISMGALPHPQETRKKVNSFLFLQITFQFLKFYTNGITDYAFCFAWLFSVSIVILRVIHIVIYCNSSFFLLLSSISLYG